MGLTVRWHIDKEALNPVPPPLSGSRPHRLKAWIQGPFAVHASLGARGFSLTHRASGKLLRPWVATKEAAFAAASRLELLTDWNRADIPPRELHRARPILDEMPVVTRFKAPLRLPKPTTEEAVKSVR
jgi:hypothetical protein